MFSSLPPRAHVPRLIESTVLMSRPLGFTATPASSGFTATTGRSAGKRRNWYSAPSVSASARSLSRSPGHMAPDGLYRRSPSHVPCKSRRPGSRRLYAGHRLAHTRAPARLISEGAPEPPISMSSTELRRLNSDTRPGDLPGRALLERLPGPHLTRSSRAVSLSLTTTVFSQRSTGWFSARPRRPTLEGQQASISRTAPPMKMPPTCPPLQRS